MCIRDRCVCVCPFWLGYLPYSNAGTSTSIFWVLTSSCSYSCLLVVNFVTLLYRWEEPCGCLHLAKWMRQRNIRWSVQCSYPLSGVQWTPLVSCTRDVGCMVFLYWHRRSDSACSQWRTLLFSCGVYRVLCSCRKVYIGTIKHSIKSPISVHRRHCCVGQTQKSPVAE